MERVTKNLYSFLGFHSFLIGLFLFYIPVYLYKTGFFLPRISLFIALSGLGFCVTLYAWDRISKKVSLHTLILLSFLSEFALLSAFLMEKNIGFILLSGCLNGCFNCNFWIIQRFFFLETITPENSGKKFGNFQIFVLIILKIAIFIGGILLEHYGFFPVYILSAVIAVTGTLFFQQKTLSQNLDPKLTSTPALTIYYVTAYTDTFRSKPVFALDGVFLYLESYFWVISLFLIVRQSYWKLGLLVIFLTLVFGAIFILIKNRIDTLPKNRMYQGAVCLYSLSWILRSLASDRLGHISMLVFLAVITFCTSLFRLGFNKRFFDNAKKVTAHEYILIKSYYSQAFLAVFGLAGFFMLKSAHTAGLLSACYLAAAAAAFIYSIYADSPNTDHAQ